MQGRTFECDRACEHQQFIHSSVDREASVPGLDTTNRKSSIRGGIMRYRNVCLEHVEYLLPEETVTSDQIEERLNPLYERLRLPPGRLELMTGIQARRFWPPETLPGQKSAQVAENLLQDTDFDRSRIGALVHASVCRDHLEPATACAVHHRLGLPEDCLIHDVSNACLGLLTGMLQVANMIELGQIQAGLIVGTEGSRQLVENTIEWLNAQTALTRAQAKLAMASLTIGSGSAAILLVNREISQTQNLLLGGTYRAQTEHHQLCHSGRDEAMADGMQPLMDTDSERLLQEGIAAGRATFSQFLGQMNWKPGDIDKSICHQVGSAHRRLMMESLQLDMDRDFATFPTLGNTGSVALPITLAQALEKSHISSGDQLALLGIGSGINVVMLAARWERSLSPRFGRDLSPSDESLDLHNGQDRAPAPHSPDKARRTMSPSK